MVKVLLPIAGVLLLFVTILIATIGAGAAFRKAAQPGVVRQTIVAHRSPKPRRYSDRQRTLLIVVTLAAAFAGFTVGRVHGDAWWAIPAAVWLAVFGSVEYTIDRRRRFHRAEQRRLTDVREAERLRAELQVARDREQRDRLGKDGVALLSRGRRTAKRIARTEAARTGWLGQAEDYDFAGDLRSLEEELAQIIDLRKTIAEARALPDPTVDDERLSQDADAAVVKLEGIVQQRVRVMEHCALEAERVDDLLCAERARLQLEQQRDDVRGRLGAMVYGVELTPASPPSDAVDAVVARVAAFRELRDAPRLPEREIDETEDIDPPADTGCVPGERSASSEDESGPVATLRAMLRFVGLGR